MLQLSSRVIRIDLDIDRRHIILAWIHLPQREAALVLIILMHLCQRTRARSLRIIPSLSPLSLYHRHIDVRSSIGCIAEMYTNQVDLSSVRMAGSLRQPFFL